MINYRDISNFEIEHVHNLSQGPQSPTSWGHIGGDLTLPKLGKILPNREREIMKANSKKEELKKDRRNTYVLSRYSGNWHTPIHKTIKKLKDKRGLGWLRARMVNKCHQNLKEMLLGDITHKCMRNIAEFEYMKRTQIKKCNCRSTYKPSGRC